MTRFALVLTALLGVSACAPGGTSTTPPAAIGEADRGSYGVIVSCRPIEATAGGDVRGAILGAVGGPAGNGAGQGAAEAVFEFIVREGSGQTLSVVQTNAAGLRPGERVVLSMSPRARLSRAAD